MPVMSPSTIGSPGPSRLNDLLQGGFGPTPNETVDACSENAQLKVGNFGISGGHGQRLSIPS